MNKFSVYILFLLTPTFLLAEEPASGTLIMISSIGTWVFTSAAIQAIRRSRHARQKQQNASASFLD